MRTVTAVVCLLAVSLVLGACGSDAPNGQRTGSLVTIPAAERAVVSPLAGPDLQEDRKQVSTADFAGQVVVINIWGAWCGPCRAETGQLEEAFRATKDGGVQFVGVNVRDNVRSYAQDFARDRQVSYPSIYDPPGRTLSALRDYSGITVPTTVVLDRRHRVAAYYLGGLLASDIVPTIEAVAAES